MMKKQRISLFKTGVLCFFMLFLCFFSGMGVAKTDEKSSFDAGMVKSQPNTQDLAFSKEWLTLVHYQTSVLGGYQSSIDSSSFFLAEKGKTNPLAEYIATIELFQGNDVAKQCLFPARFLYLKKQGVLDTSFPSCGEYEQFKKDLNPAGVTLLYTDAYMNNPASLFGHTLMRVDIPEGRTQLVAHGMNYGAFVDPNENGMLFAVYGLTGMYYGGFTVKPYYNVINMYNNVENRDIWEFQLNLSQQEQDFYVAHLWEIGHTQTKYYFFTKNCSYLLMEVLDVIRPDMNLASQFPLQTIPLDTLKAVASQKNLVKEVNYRPSRQRRLAYRYGQMTSDEKDALLSYLQNSQQADLSALPSESQIAVLDTAYEYIQYQWVRQDIPLEVYRQKSLDTLKKRRNIPQTSSKVVVLGLSPLVSHDSARVELSAGLFRGKTFQEISIRPAYHSLTDMPDGLLRGAEINFLDTTIRYYNQTRRVYLQNIDVLKISSLSPYNALFHPLSYQVHTFVKREFNPKTQEEGTVYTLKGGSGLTFEPFSDFYVFGLAHTAFSYGGSFMPHHQGISFGVSGGVGSYFKYGQVWLEGAQFISDNWWMQKTSAKSEVVFNLDRNWVWGFSYEITNQKYHSASELKTSIKRYF